MQVLEPVLYDLYKFYVSVCNLILHECMNECKNDRTPNDTTDSRTKGVAQKQLNNAGVIKTSLRRDGYVKLYVCMYVCMYVSM